MHEQKRRNSSTDGPYAVPSRQRDFEWMLCSASVEYPKDIRRDKNASARQHRHAGKPFFPSMLLYCDVRNSLSIHFHIVISSSKLLSEKPPFVRARICRWKNVSRDAGTMFLFCIFSYLFEAMIDRTIRPYTQYCNAVGRRLLTM